MTRHSWRNLLIALVCVIGPTLYGAVAYDATANLACDKGSGCAGGTTLTYSLTVGAAGAERQLGVFVFTSCQSGQTAPDVSTVTYAGVGLTRIVHNSPNAARYGDLWAMSAGTQPATGANNVVVTLVSTLTGCAGSDAGATLQSGAISVTGVDQTTTFTASNGNNGTSTSTSLSLSSSGASDLGVSGACHGFGDLVSTTETSRYINDFSGSNSCGTNAGATAAAADTSWSWTAAGSDSWIHVGGVFKASGGGATTSPTRTLTGVGK